MEDVATALYRRYRPEAFSEMIGQAHVTEPLMTALRAGRIGHAYLFSGPRGCGKTTSARILARCLNCAEGPTDTPCGVCPSCVELSRDGGGSLDVVEIDAASHGGVDDARELRERAVFAPARDRYKIFIIDEAHMVTSGGFNALLKIVEEPPPHVKFIFATTEPEKVIGTIRSRTHHYPFRLIAPGALMDYVQQLCESEGVQVEPGVLALVVRSGGGSVRDTLSILDQLIAGSESGAVSLERATGLLGFTSGEVIDEVVGALGVGDAAAAFRATDRVVQTGQDPRRFVEDLLERLRDLIVISATSVQGASAVFRGVPEDQLDAMFAQSQSFSPAQLSRLADTVSGALDTMVGATAPRLHLELMVARALLAAHAAPVNAAAPALATAGQHPQSSRPAPAAPAPAGGQPSSSAPSRDVPARAASGQAVSQQTESVESSPRVDAPSRQQAAQEGASAPQAAAPVPNDVIAAMRSAREFLKSDDSGVSRPPMVPLGGHHPDAAAQAAAPVGAGDNTAAQADAGTPADLGSPGEAGVAPSAAERVPEAQAPQPRESSGSETPHPTAAPGAVSEPASATQQGSSAASDSAVESELSPSDQPGLDDLREVWPDLLEELLESNREAWNAVRQVEPLAFEGDILTVGLASKADLDAFKSSGAGPLREALSAALGLSVKYVPKPLPEGVRPSFAGRESDEQAAEEPSPTAETTALPRAESAAPAGPAQVAYPTSAPAADDYSEPEPHDDVPPEPEFEPDYETSPEAREATGANAPAEVDPPEPEREPALEREPAHEPAPAPEREPAHEPAPEPAREPDVTQESAAAARIAAVAQLAADHSLAPALVASGDAPSSVAPAPSSTASAVAEPPTEKRESPGFTRYGESVVREVLGARFIEERPLPEEFQR